MTNLTQLPPELIIIIFRYLNLQSGSSLVLTCKRMYETIKAYWSLQFSTVSLNTEKFQICDLMLKLKRFSLLTKITVAILWTPEKLKVTPWEWNAILKLENLDRLRIQNCDFRSLPKRHFSTISSKVSYLMLRSCDVEDTEIEDLFYLDSLRPVYSSPSS